MKLIRWYRSASTVSAALVVLSSAMRKLHTTQWHKIAADRRSSVEHEDIDIVACNDPFIEPHYAVSPADHHFKSICSFRPHP